MIKYKLIVLLSICFASSAYAQEDIYNTKYDLAYRDAEERLSDYASERCRLDIYYPVNRTNFSTLIWFHGGGLTSGNKYLPEELVEQGIAVVSVNYRLYPKVKCPVYIDDAAAAVAWTYKHIHEYGGTTNKLYVSGHSAGGYLANMVAIDKSWLLKYQVDADKLSGILPLSGHTITHFTVREERNIPGVQSVVDEFAPLYHVRKDAPPYLLITGDRELELLGRYEENAFFARMMKVAGHENTELLELDGYGHGMVTPAIPLVVKQIKEWSGEVYK